MMPTTTRTRLLLGVVLLICLGGAGVVLLQPGSPINPDNFAKIEIGMTVEEVVNIFGGPGQPGDGLQIWSGPAWVAIVYFDNGLVSSTCYGPNPQSVSAKLRRWVGLRA